MLDQISCNGARSWRIQHNVIGIADPQRRMFHVTRREQHCNRCDTPGCGPFTGPLAKSKKLNVDQCIFRIQRTSQMLICSGLRRHVWDLDNPRTRTTCESTNTDIEGNKLLTGRCGPAPWCIAPGEGFHGLSTSGVQCWFRAEIALRSSHTTKFASWIGSYYTEDRNPHSLRTIRLSLDGAEIKVCAFRFLITSSMYCRYEICNSFVSHTGYMWWSKSGLNYMAI